VKAIEQIASNPNKWEKLDEKKKEDFFNMTRKFEIKVKTHEDILEEEREKERLIQERIEREKERLREIEKERLANMKTLRIEITQNPNINYNNIDNNSIGDRSNNYNQINIVSGGQLANNSSTEPNDKAKALAKSTRKRLTIVEGDNVDSNDTKLDQSLINIYNKKRMSFIPVKKLGEDNYEFGSQRIQIKIDGDIIRGI